MLIFELGDEYFDSWVFIVLWVFFIVFEGLKFKKYLLSITCWDYKDEKRGFFL